MTMDFAGRHFLFALLAALALGGCGQDGPVPEDTPIDGAPEASRDTTPTRAEEASSPSPRRAGSDRPFDCAALRPAALVQDAQRGEKGARNLLLEWAAALEHRRFDTAWCQFAEDGSASGLSRADFARFWDRYERLSVAVQEGRIEGAAGTSYYAAPATITATTASGDEVVFEGDVVLRRVNDVPGASAEQLLWQIRSADLNRRDGG